VLTDMLRRPIVKLTNALSTIFMKLTFLAIALLKVKNIRRKLLCLALIFSLLILPVQGSLGRQLSVLASTTAHSVSASTSYIPALLKWVFGSPSKKKRAAKLTAAQRLNSVASIEVLPGKFVGYQGQMVSLGALGRNAQGELLQGIKFNWSSSDPDKVRIDDSGQAIFLNEGKATISCQAGNSQSTIPVLIKPGQRPLQSDSQWQADQTLLSRAANSSNATASSGLFDKLANAIAPTASAQVIATYNDVGYDQLYSEPRNQVGLPTNGVIDSWKLGKVVPESNNFTMAIPLYSLGGRGLGASLTLQYNSRVWSRRLDGSTEKVTWNATPGSRFAGYSLGFGRILTYGTSGSTKYIWIEPNGTRHYLGSGAASTTGTYQSTDGSLTTYVGNATSGGHLYFNDGTKVTITLTNNRLLPTKITDTNGNYISMSYKWDTSTEFYAPMSLYTVTDTLGRIILCNYTAVNGNMELTSVSAPTFDDTYQDVVTIENQDLTVSYNFSGLTVENAPSGTQRAPRRIYFNDKSTGYLLSYSPYGMVNNISVRKNMFISSAITDGTEAASASFNYPSSGSTTLSDAPAFTQYTDSPGGTYTYSNSEDTLNKTKTFKTVRPDSSELWLTRSTDSSATANGLMTESLIKNSSSATMAKSVYAYTTDGGGSKQVESVIGYNDANVATKIGFSYDSFGNITNTREYGFQISGNWQVRRRTQSVYKTDSAYTNLYMRSLLTEAYVYDGKLNTSDGDDDPVSKTLYTYDDYSGSNSLEDYDGTATPPGHTASYDDTYTTRGNVTQVKKYKSISGNQYIQTTTRYDIFGNVVQDDTSCCNQQTQTFEEDDYWSKPVSVTKGSNSGPQLTTSTVYDFNTDLPVEEIDVDGLITEYDYDVIGRPIERGDPEGSTTTVSYDAANLKTTTTTTYAEGSNTITITTSATVNGWGRTITTVNQHNGQVNTSYDSMGRVSSETTPFQSGGSPAYSTSFTYDALGRPLTSTLPDSNTIQTSYNGASMTTTDQVGRQMYSEKDGLGRLVKVSEQDNSTGSLTQNTTSTLNYLDKVTEINQSGQYRTFRYDDLGRLLYEKIPEQTATINDGSGTYWTMAYTYTDTNQIATQKNALGVIKSLTYDGLNRLTDIDYNVSGTSVPATDSVQYVYSGADLNQVRLHVGATDHYIDQYTYDSYNRLASKTRSMGTSYVTSYEYNGGNQLKKLTYPDGREVAYNHDSNGTLESVVHANGSSGNVTNNYASGTTYNYARQLTAWTMADVITESFGYSAQRQQLTSQSVVGPSSTNFLNLTYGYSASSGQSGTGSTAGNSGQLMSTSGTVYGTSESSANTYDLQKRLLTSSQSTNGVTAQRRFDIDAWGNRTKVYDATSGGNRLQDIELEQSGGVPTNRIQRVHSPATNVAAASNGATATASSTYHSTNTPVSAVINGDRKGVNWGSGGGWMDNTPSTYPDWVQVDFSGSKSISEIDVFSIQDNYSSPSEPTESMTFSNYGLTIFGVQYWNGSAWQSITGFGGGVTGNDKVWKKFTFSSVTTDKIRVNITGAADGISRIAEVEAYGSYVYDAAGNLTRDEANTYSYDAEHRLIQVDGGTTASYVYDHENRRIKSTIGSTVTHYAWEGIQVLSEHDANNNGAVKVDYIYADGRLLAREVTGAGETQFLLRDLLSIRLVLGYNRGTGAYAVRGRQGHLPFGEELGTSGTNDKHNFTSYERNSEINSDNAINRQYLQSLGRFNRVDPYNGSYEGSDPQTFNRYTYVQNDPVNLFDPLGLVAACDIRFNSAGSIEGPEKNDARLRWYDHPLGRVETGINAFAFSFEVIFGCTGTGKFGTNLHYKYYESNLVWRNKRFGDLGNPFPDETIRKATELGHISAYVQWHATAANLYNYAYVIFQTQRQGLFSGRWAIASGTLIWVIIASIKNKEGPGYWEKRADIVLTIGAGNPPDRWSFTPYPTYYRQ
jgi:RHS repeat-associated protein